MRGLSPNFHIHVSVSGFIYSQNRSKYCPAKNINRSRGRAIPFMGIFVLNFPYGVFVVRMKPLQYKIVVTTRQLSFGIFRLILTFFWLSLKCYKYEFDKANTHRFSVVAIRLAVRLV